MKPTKFLHVWLECQSNIYNGWEGVLRVEEPVVHQTRVLSAKLFDVENRTGLRPLVARRRVPTDISDMARHEWEASNGHGHSDSYASYPEVKEFVRKMRLPKNLDFLFQAMEKMYQTHGEDNVRVVVWFTEKP